MNQRLLYSLILLFTWVVFAFSTLASPKCSENLKYIKIENAVLAEKAGLLYISPKDFSQSSIMRKKSGGNYSYFSSNGRKITNKAELTRIQNLNIPSAYHDVLISPDPLSHIQATALDAKERMQYRYHPKWNEIKAEYKFIQIYHFGKALGNLRSTIRSDLGLKGLPYQKIQAVIVRLLDRTAIRIGNEEYAEANGSYGLTTFLKKHLRLDGTKITFSFLGKSSVRHSITIEDAKLARVLKELKELPGKNLFQYIDEEEELHSITSNDINDYISSNAEGTFSAKDFRTWTATTLAAEEFWKLGPPPSTKKELDSKIKQVMTTVSEKLGNTPSIARKSYVSPQIIEAYIEWNQFNTAFKKANQTLHESEILSEKATLLVIKP